MYLVQRVVCGMFQVQHLKEWSDCSGIVCGVGRMLAKPYRAKQPGLPVAIDPPTPSDLPFS